VAVEGQVSVEGLAELRRALRRIDPALLKGVRTALKKGAEVVRDEAKKDAAVRSGLMRDRTRAFTSGNVAGVRVRATAPDGYAYPRRIEYEDDGVRSFVRKALSDKQQEVIRELEKMLDDIAETFEGKP